jgi:hypothetical protein
MDIAPLPAESRIQEVGDRLIVRFRPARSWGALAFLVFWLTFWTAGGIAAFTRLLDADWSERPFLLLWLCFWAFGESMVSGIIAWQLVGRELLVVTPEQFEVRREIGPFARTKLYDVALTRAFKAARVPSAEDEGPRKDFCLEFAYDDGTVRIGEGMSEREAEHIASTVLARVSPRTWWGQETPTEPYEPPIGDPDGPAPRRRRRLGILTQLVFPLLVLVAIAGALVTGRSSHQKPESQPSPVDTSPRGPMWPPTMEDQFASIRVLASATTFQSLMSAGTTVLSQPACRPHPTWQQWTCTVTARPTLPPFAGRTLLYRCSAVLTPQPGGGPAGRGVLCGPDPPLPLGG